MSSQYNSKSEMLLSQPPKFIPIGSYSREKTEHGFELPSGERLLIASNMSGAVTSMWMRQLKGKEFYVKGTWLFTPDLETISFVEARRNHG